MKVQIGVVGPCAAGKTTLVDSLKKYGYACKHIAQEHSYVDDMWKRLTNPDILIYLDVSYPLTIERRHMDWTHGEYQEQLRRLKHARSHADLYINTDELTSKEVLTKVLKYLNTPSPSPPDI
jgi:deoxyadenosine/deoxycytidine kinase